MITNKIPHIYHQRKRQFFEVGLTTHQAKPKQKGSKDRRRLRY